MTRRPYVQPMAPSWWMQQGRYVKYMFRELTCLFIALNGVVLMVGLYRLSQGPDAFATFLSALWSPLGQAFYGLVLLMALVHSVTWFNLTPKAMPLWLGDKKIPGWVIIGAHYIGWIGISIFLLLMVGGLLNGTF